MATQNQDQKFFEVIKPHSNYEFIGRTKYWVGLSIVLTIVTFAMIFLNAYVIKSRGHFLNWGVDFRGGSEILVEFAHDVDVQKIREALAESGFHDADVVKYGDPAKWNYLVRVGAVSVLSEKQTKAIRESMAKVGDASLRRLDWTEGGDKLYLRYDKPLEPSVIQNSLKALGVSANQVQGFGRADDNTYEVTLVGLDTEIRRHLETKLGAGAVAAIPKVDSVGAKAGNQLKVDGAKSLIYAILLIMVYIAFRFDLRYGPGTVVALLHDAVITIGAFAITYKEFSLTTVAAVLTIIGFSMNDTVVVFDRIRENRGKFGHVSRDVVNDSINQTLSRTLLTGGTTILTIFVMYIFGGPGIHGFTFALLIGIVVGTYSSIAIASPILLIGTPPGEGHAQRGRGGADEARQKTSGGQLQRA